MKIPHAQSVSKAIRSVRQASKKALKALNVAAGQRMAKGDYAAAEAFAAKGKEIREFQGEVETLRKRWRELASGGSGTAKNAVTPLWAYYQPILQALTEADGESGGSELEGRVERIMAPSLQAGDRVTSGQGRERWRIMIERARKPLISEGWIDRTRGKTWRITEAGRRAAESPMSPEVRSRRYT